MQIHDFSGEELEDVASEFFTPQIVWPHPDLGGRVAVQGLGQAVPLYRSRWGECRTLRPSTTA
ncbi:hypothetical protein [Pseudonocardia adelaidensis]|uniref:hypothetical protein n=1 Tax=Pseudonocardia adelaidensis TaxID=648754 RepID=UPI0031E67B11